jgi:hypothetical protein
MAHILRIVPEGWYYAGPVATSSDTNSRVCYIILLCHHIVADNRFSQQNGLILHAADESALADVIQWVPVANLGPVSTWRGIAPNGYVVAGDIFVQGPVRPTPEQTYGIKAIRQNLVNDLDSQRKIWQAGAMSLWDVVALPLVFVPTGAFRSSNTPGQPNERAVVLLFNS